MPPPPKAAPEPVAIDGDTPTLRLFSLLEVIARKNHFFSLPALVEETGLPKPTLHRMLQQLESAGMIQREADGRHYGMALRLRRLGEDLLFNSTVHGARHAVLRTLVDEVGESCNITALSGGEVLYLDRVETPAPLRFYLQPGSRVPVHCSASGKLFLAQMPDAQRSLLLDAATLERYTPKHPHRPRRAGSARSSQARRAMRSTAKSSCPACCASPCWCRRPTAAARTPASPSRRR
jgi:IclR family acetate operon transcriptional repressor